MEYDTFSRPNQSGWGTATNGKTWSTDDNTASLSIASNEGVVTGGTGAVHLQLGSAKRIDNQALMRTSLMVNSGLQVISGIILRGTNFATNTYYAFLMIYSPPSTATVQILAPNNILQTNFSISVNTYYWIHAIADGETLSMKVWPDGLTEPITPIIATNDQTITDAGGFGIFTRTSDSGSSVKVDHFLVCGND